MEAMNAVKKTKTMSVRNMVQAAMLGCIATVLMLFEFPLWFAPPFYEMDLSEVAVLIGSFAMGPLAGAAIEMIKILMNFVINGSITAGIGEAANFIIGCALVVPAGWYYRKNHTRKGAVLGLLAGSFCMVIAAGFLNAFLLLPAYAAAFGMGSMEPLIQMGTMMNPSISGLGTFVLFAVTPFNLVKAVVTSLVTMLLYKKVSVLFRQHY